MVRTCLDRARAHFRSAREQSAGERQVGAAVGGGGRLQGLPETPGHRDSSIEALFRLNTGMFVLEGAAPCVVEDAGAPDFLGENGGAADPRDGGSLLEL